MSSAHGRPRMLSATDSTMEEPSVDDFDNPEDVRAHVFVHYVKIAGILCDLSHAVARRGSTSPQERDILIRRLLEYERTLPYALRLVHQDGSQRPYNFDLAQLHIPFLTAIAILYRPKSIFAVTSANAASVAAANLSFRVFQAIQLREETRALSSAFSYHMLVCAIPHLSCLRVEELKAEANSALDALELVLQTLGTVRPAAANNLRNVKTIRKAIDAKDRPSLRASRRSSFDARPRNVGLDPALSELFSQYGPQAIRNLESVVSVLEAAEEVPLPPQHQLSGAQSERQWQFDAQHTQGAHSFAQSSRCVGGTLMQILPEWKTTETRSQRCLGHTFRTICGCATGLMTFNYNQDHILESLRVDLVPTTAWLRSCPASPEPISSSLLR